MSGKSIKSVSRGRASGCGTTGEREFPGDKTNGEKADQTLAENKEKEDKKNQKKNQKRRKMDYFPRGEWIFVANIQKLRSRML